MNLEIRFASKRLWSNLVARANVLKAQLPDSTRKDGLSLFYGWIFISAAVALLVTKLINLCEEQAVCVFEPT